MQTRRFNLLQQDRYNLTATDDLVEAVKLPSAIPFGDELWNVKIVKLKTGLSRTTLYKYVKLGLFPRQRQLGPGRVAWRASDVRDWIESRPEWRGAFGSNASRASRPNASSRGTAAIIRPVAHQYPPLL